MFTLQTDMCAIPSGDVPRAGYNTQPADADCANQPVQCWCSSPLLSTFDRVEAERKMTGSLPLFVLDWFLRIALPSFH